ncbi:hypothetical protein [Microviridae sp.]|nr:hypothetical protein [Microviridae sp.]
MARKKNSKKKRSRLQRNISPITRRKLLRSRVYDPFKRRKEPLTEDLRYFRPPIDRDYRLKDGRKVSYSLTAPKRKSKLKDPTLHRIGFSDPLNTQVCIKRKRRRETLFKLRKIGKGKSGSRKPKRLTDRSSIRC